MTPLLADRDHALVAGRISTPRNDIPTRGIAPRTSWPAPMPISEHGTFSSHSYMLLQRRWRLDARDQTSCTRGTDSRLRPRRLVDRKDLQS